ncbi:MAG: hypothetical protein OEM61_08320 [Desulfobacteraceae bacterium]|nr:hypothetical protein [Desulfobacteraceae bacterium]MDH3567347.1 hypothetical protein [Desulfobacteraceae bacterium]
MKIQEITEKFRSLEIFEKRCINDEYAEIVIFTEQLNHCSKILEGFLGPAVKPFGLEPSKIHEKVADEFGGIFKNQTLFQKDCDDIMVIAMFWPWGNGKQVTLKIAVARRKK